MGPVQVHVRSWLTRVSDGPALDTDAMTEERRALIAVGVVFTLLGGFAVFCRIFALLQHRRRLYYDDWALFAAFFFSIGFAIASYVAVRWGVGLDIGETPTDGTLRAIQAEYAVEIFYYFSIFLIKMSIMFLYWRLSSELRNHFYYGTVIVIVLLCVQFCTTLVAVSVQCVPIKKYWSPTVPGTCINITAFFYSTNVFTVITDVFMLVLPLRTVWRVPGPKSLKIGVVAAFLCGGLSTLTSCIRLYSVKIYTESLVPTRDAAPIDTWSFIEINIGICCASIAAMKQAIVAVRKGSLISKPGTKRSKSTETWSTCPSSASSSPQDADDHSRSSKSSEDAEVGRDLDGSPVRQSARLPPPPDCGSLEQTVLPQKPSQPLLRAFVTWERNGESLTNLSASRSHVSRAI